MSLGSLMTTWTPPASCLASLTAVGYENGAYYQGPVMTSDCFPPNYEFARTNYYSPGICPQGYYSVGIKVNSAADVRETVVTCCPPNMAPNTMTNPSWAATMGCSSRFGTETFDPVTMLSNKISESTKSTVEGGGALNAFSIQIRFQEGDFASTTTESSSSSTSGADSDPTGTGGSGSDNGNPDGNDNGDEQDSGGLSTGAIVGIVLGSVGGVLIMAAACGAAFILGRRRGKEKKAALEGPVSGPSPQMAGMGMAGAAPPPSQYGGSPSATGPPQQYPYSYSPVSGKPMYPSPNFTPMTHFTGSQSMPGGDAHSTASGYAAHTPPPQPPVEMPVPDNHTYNNPSDHYTHDNPTKDPHHSAAADQSPGWR